MLQIWNGTDTVSVRFNGHFPGGPGLAGTVMSPFWILLELGVMDVVVTMGATRSAKLQSHRHQQQTNTQFFFYRPDTLHVAQPTVSEHRMIMTLLVKILAMLVSCFGDKLREEIFSVICYGHLWNLFLEVQLLTCAAYLDFLSENVYSVSSHFFSALTLLVGWVTGRESGL